jgi:IMP dehydrogenase
MIVDPITLGPDAPLSKALDLMARFSISGVPITTDGRLVGILTNRDHRFETDFERPIREVMTPHERLVTAPVGTTLEEARAILHRHRIEKLPVVDPQGNLRGLITVKDIQKRKQYPTRARTTWGACASRPRSARAATSSSVLPRWSRPRWMPSWSTPRTATRRA